MLGAKFSNVTTQSATTDNGFKDKEKREKNCRGDEWNV